MTTKKRYIELLCPARDYRAAIAAIDCGADALYIGAEGFGARRAATNATEDIARVVDYAHLYGVRVYVTLNTILYEGELQRAEKLARELIAVGVDALIVQDMAYYMMDLPIPLHASTQMSVHTPSGVRALHEMGFKRVVLSREMSRDEIKECAKIPIELEVFVHGALCMSVSGQCYFSAMLGSRSGNRGACAQTCRLPFEPTGDGKPRPCSADKAALSLKDNCLIDYVQDLAAMGVRSLKIEGRMKRPEYVAAATAVYAGAVRGEIPSPADLERLKSVFSRTGFTDGYYTDKRGGGMFGIRRHEDVTAAAPVLKELARTYDKEVPRVGIALALTIDETESRLALTDEDGHTVTVCGEGGDVSCIKVRHKIGPL